MPHKSSSRQKLTPKELRDLDIEIEFMAGVVRRAPDYIEALQVLGDDYTRRGRFADGLDVDEQLVRLRPGDPLTHYNLACSYALTIRFQDAVKSLERALDLGYNDFKWISRDPDLRRLRRHPLFKKIREQIKALNAKG
jgi:tetratricopeptide (TPR) repeat protein